MKIRFILTILTVLTTLTTLPTQAATFPDLTLGNASAPIKLEVFNDFQCPYCARFHKTLNTGVIQKFVRAGELQIIFKDFPLSFHTHAETAAKATNAVLSINSSKAKRFMMYIFRTQHKWESLENASTTFEDYAIKLGIDAEQYKQAFMDPMNIQEIKDDIQEGVTKGVNGTPSYFINGAQQTGAYPLRTLVEQIKAAK